MDPYNDVSIRGYGGGLVGAQAPDNYQLQQAMQQKQYAQLAGAKEASVQDRLGTTLDALGEAHRILSMIEGNVGPENAPSPPLGLIGGSLACAETAQSLCKRLSELKNRLGSL